MVRKPVCGPINLGQQNISIGIKSLARGLILNEGWAPPTSNSVNDPTWFAKVALQLDEISAGQNLCFIRVLSFHKINMMNNLSAYYRFLPWVTKFQK